MFALLLIAVPILFAGALMSKARQAALTRQAAEKRKPLDHAAIQIPLVNVVAPENFIPPISIVITDSQGHTTRVVVDKDGIQHPEPVLNLN